MAGRLAVVMDPIASITPYKDSTLAMLLAAQARGWQLDYLEQGDLYLENGEARGRSRALEVRDDNDDWYRFIGEPEDGPLARFETILMRKDPPFDQEYVYSTYILERAGTQVVNPPRALRDYNEKAAIARFPQCCAPTLVTRDAARVREFLARHEQIVVKPLDGMGGTSVFRLGRGDPNRSVILETLIGDNARSIMAQRYIPEIAAGDKRILMIDGEPVDHALARIPAAGESRGNLAAGGKGVAQPLSERDRWICGQVASALREAGLLFVGLDVIGDYLTEVNVTSPTCIRELEAATGQDIAGRFIDVLNG